MSQVKGWALLSFSLGPVRAGVLGPHRARLKRNDVQAAQDEVQPTQAAL